MPSPRRATDDPPPPGAIAHSSVLHLMLRRMRMPLLVLIGIYAVSVLGFTLVPGVDAQGRASPPLSFFHAFYFVTYTATTIGFGEVPDAFSNAQRMWAMAVIYLSVVGWTYTLLGLLAMFKDAGFQRAIAAIRFERRVSAIGEPFYLVLGCGDTGRRLAHVFDRRGTRFVTVDIDASRLDELELEDFRNDIVALHADASSPQVLIRAGLQHRECRGVLALTNDDTANLAVVTSAHLLNRTLPVIARAHAVEATTLMQSFGNPQIVDPFVAFAEQLMMAMRAPGCYRLFDWLTAPPDTTLARELEPPGGTWIVCGYGRFGRAVADRLVERGATVRVLDPSAEAATNPDVVRGGASSADVSRADASRADASRADILRADGTRREALERAGIASAQALVAGTDDDLRNLAIASLARTLNDRLFVVLRQNEADNGVLFENFRAQLVMRPSEIVADECMALLTSPLLIRFLRIVRGQTDAWADEVIHQLRKRSGKATPTTWELRVERAQAPAVCDRLASDGSGVRLGDLMRNPDSAGDAVEPIEALALLALRNGRQTLLPGDDWALQEGDELLFAGRERARRLMTAVLCNPDALEYACTGYVARHWPFRGAKA